MDGSIFDDIDLEKSLHEQFGRKLDIRQVVVRDVPVGVSARATLFLTTQNALYVYVVSQAPQVLGDVKKSVTRMGLLAETFLPPATEPDYFDRIGLEKFKRMFPGHHAPDDQALVYYRSLAPYNPALVKITRVKNGELHTYVAEGNYWRKLTDFSYSRIKTT